MLCITSVFISLVQNSSSRRRSSSSSLKTRSELHQRKEMPDFSLSPRSDEQYLKYKTVSHTWYGRGMSDSTWRTRPSAAAFMLL